MWATVDNLWSVGCPFDVAYCDSGRSTCLGTMAISSSQTVGNSWMICRCLSYRLLERLRLSKLVQTMTAKCHACAKVIPAFNHLDPIHPKCLQLSNAEPEEPPKAMKLQTRGSKCHLRPEAENQMPESVTDRRQGGVESSPQPLLGPITFGEVVPSSQWRWSASTSQVPFPESHLRGI